MMQIIGTLLGTIAVICVALELPLLSALFGAVAMWMINHGT